jgi:hypothetical protein
MYTSVNGKKVRALKVHGIDGKSEIEEVSDIAYV